MFNNKFLLINYFDQQEAHSLDNKSNFINEKTLLFAKFVSVN